MIIFFLFDLTVIKMIGSAVVLRVITEADALYGEAYNASF